MIPLFVYGTIAQDDVQMRVLGHLCQKVSARLEGYRVCRGRWLYLLPKKQGVVEGWILTGLSDGDLVKLDAYERINSVADLADNEIYERRKADIRPDEGGIMKCWVYFPMMEKWRSEWLEKGKSK